jgi:hypothetical protein
MTDMERLREAMKSMSPKDRGRIEALIGKMPIDALLQLAGLKPVNKTKS